MATETRGQNQAQTSTITTAAQLEALAAKAFVDRDNFRRIGLEIGGAPIRGVQNVLENLAIHTEASNEECVDAIRPQLIEFVANTRTNRDALNNVDPSVGFNTGGWTFNKALVMEAIWRGAEKMRTAALSKLVKAKYARR